MGFWQQKWLDYTLTFYVEEYPKIDFFAAYHRIFILTDLHTKTFCLPVFFEKNDFLKNRSQILSLPFGESEKNLDNVTKIWDFLLQNQAEKTDLFCILGGGVLSDLGAFAASTYKRGMDFIQIPTSFLAQIDAAIGGKTGFNFQNYKNNIGTFTVPKAIVIDSDFLKTLEKEHFLASYGEIFKYALIDSKQRLSWEKIDESTSVSFLIEQCIAIKNDFLVEDFWEKEKRKWLNFGHNFAHAWEGFFLSKGKILLHGEAVFWGLIFELFLAKNTEKIIKKLIDFGKKHYIFPDFPDFEKLIPYLLQDKKNTQNQIQFVFFEGLGQCKIQNFELDFLAQKYEDCKKNIIDVKT